MEYRSIGKIKLGTGLKTGEDFRNALKQANINVLDEASFLLGGYPIREQPDIEVEPEETEVEVCIVRVADLFYSSEELKRHEELGLSSGACQSNILEKAQELGFGICPVELASQLCLQYEMQKQEVIIVASRTISTSSGYGFPQHHFFKVFQRYGQTFLNGADTSRGYTYQGRDLLAFIEGKNMDPSCRKS